MKILVKGTVPQEREWKVTCYNCRTMFECLAKEGKVHHDQRDGSYITVVCPVCGYACSGSPK